MLEKSGVEREGEKGDVKKRRGKGGEREERREEREEDNTCHPPE